MANKPILVKIDTSKNTTQLIKPNKGDDNLASNDNANDRLMNGISNSQATAPAQTATTSNTPTTGNSTTTGYQSPYSTQIQSILNGITNQQPFTYNMNTDPLYQQYAEQYTRDGNLAMRDTIGNADAQTGGYGSSYATTAGSQANDSYMQQLNDRVPELYQLAYGKYQDDLGNKYNELNALSTQDQYQYGQYRDKVADNQWQQNYNQAADQWQQQYDYQNDYDKQQQSNWDTQMNYQQQQDQQAQENQQEQQNYQTSYDLQQQQNWQNTYNEQVSQDKTANSQWQQQFSYEKQQAAKQAAKQAAASNKAASTSASSNAAKASQAKVEKYTGIVEDMFKATTKDELGDKVAKYSSADVWDYLQGTNLSDDEIAAIVNDNYELRKYVESLSNNKSTSTNVAGVNQFLQDYMTFPN